MADSEKIALNDDISLNPRNPGVIIVQPEGVQPPVAQHVQYVYTQPQVAGTGISETDQQHVVYIQPTDSDVARQLQREEDMRGYEAPRHRIPTDPDTAPVGEHDAEITVVKWDNFREPIPINHAVFMRKVWGTLILQLIFTAGIIALCMYVDPIRRWVIDNYWMWIIGLVGGICVLCALMGARNEYPLNIILLIIWTAIMAYTVAMVCAAYAEYGMEDIVLQAFGITILVFISLSLFSCQTKCNLMPLGLVIWVICSTLMWWGLWSLIFGWYNASAWSLMFIIIFCLLILFDVWRMCNMPEFDEGAWIFAAINLYLDVINLFLWILRCLAYSRRMHYALQMIHHAFYNNSSSLH